MTKAARFTATAVREGDWWAVEVPELPGVFTQARRLDQVEASVRDAVSLWLQEPEDSFVIEVRPVLGEVADLVREAIERRRSADEADRAASVAMRHAAETLMGRGLTLRDVGTLLGVSYQRVQQITSGSR
jgi:predicted RNase H-like HicB family nuclease